MEFLVENPDEFRQRGLVSLQTDHRFSSLCPNPRSTQLEGGVRRYGMQPASHGSLLSKKFRGSDSKHQESRLERIFCEMDIAQPATTRTAN
mgnify:CR=1 FL=1